MPEGKELSILARDRNLAACWAVKEIPVSHKKEAKLLRLLEHPYMPRMIDYIEKEDYCYLVMEFIQGKSLEEWIKEGRRFSEEELLSFGIMIAQVLGYLHSRKPPVYYRGSEAWEPDANREREAVSGGFWKCCPEL